MAEVLCFHHAQGLTAGCLAFADELRAAGHVVHTPDLYEGRTFDSIAEGVGHAQEIGFDTIIERGTAVADGLPDGLVYAGFSLGVLPAQKLAQTRPGARGAVLMHSCVPPSEFCTPWPDGLPLQIHLMEDDEFVLPPELDLAAARELAAPVAIAELFLYPGDRHLFTDSSLRDYDSSAALLRTRVLGLLDGLA